VVFGRRQSLEIVQEICPLVFAPGVSALVVGDVKSASAEQVFDCEQAVHTGCEMSLRDSLHPASFAVLVPPVGHWGEIILAEGIE
jgi:hypothetical protein